jgi:hypothetical protein
LIYQISVNSIFLYFQDFIILSTIFLEGDLLVKKKGEEYKCDECGLVVLVEDPCGCDTCELVCCETPMKPVKTPMKKAAPKAKPKAKAKPKK